MSSRARSGGLGLGAMRARAGLVALVLAACGAPRAPLLRAEAPAPRCVDAVPPACPHGLELRPATAPPGVPSSEDAALDARDHRVLAPTSWPLGERGAVRVVERGGRRFAALDGAAVFAPWLAGGRSIERVASAENGEVMALVAASWKPGLTSDLVFATVTRDGVVAPAQRLSEAGSVVHRGAEVAAAAGGRFAVVWVRRDRERASSLELALFEPGRIVARRTVLPSIDVAGWQLLRAGDGFVYLYATGEASEPRERRGLWALWLDGQGGLRAHARLATATRDGAIGNPRAAWDGSAIAVAFGRGQEVLYARLGGRGEILTPPTVVEASPDPMASFHASALAARDGRAWIITREQASASVVSEGPPETHAVLALADGRHTPPLQLGFDGLAPPFVAEASDEGLFAVLRGRASEPARAFTVACRAAPEPPAPPRRAAKSACDATERPLAPDRFEPLRHPFVAAGLGADAAVAYVDDRPGRRRGDAAPAARWLARMTADGEVRWASRVADQGGSDPSIAVRGDEIALTWEVSRTRAVEADLQLATFDARTGALRERRSFDDAAGCVGAGPDGYVVAVSRPGPARPPARLTGRGAILRAGGAGEELASLPFGWDACAWLPTPGGFLLAFVNAEGMSEHLPLLAQAFDARLAPLGPPRVLAGGIARRPLLARAGARNVAVWTGPLERGLYAIDLGDDGAPLGEPRPLVTSDGLVGYGLLAAGGEARALYANERAVGERALCASFEGPTPRLPPAHAAPSTCARD